MLNLTINNNPKCSAYLESTVKEVAWNLENKPYLIISGSDINLKYSNIKITQDGKELFSSFIEIENNAFSIKAYLEDILENTNNIKVELDNYEETFSIKLNKIHGFVRYKDKTPVRNAIINCTYSKIMTLGDESGYFELFLNEKEDSIGIFDKNYSKETLEVWLHNIDLDNDLKIDIIMDKGEVYNIKMWNQECSTYIHFIPMSITRVHKIGQIIGLREEDLILNDNVWPKIKEEDVEVFCNNKKLEILSFGEIKDFLVSINEKNIYRRGYVVCIEKLDKKNADLIKIKFKDKFILDGNETTDFGEGYYLYK